MTMFTTKAFLLRAATKTSLPSATEIKSKLEMLEKQLSGMKSEKDNPSVSKNYYTLLGKVEALRSIISTDRVDFRLL